MTQDLDGLLYDVREALESVQDMRIALTISGHWPRGLSINNIDEALSRLDALLAAVPDMDRSLMFYKRATPDANVWPVLGAAKLLQTIAKKES
jgi:hypothetical protein